MPPQTTKRQRFDAEAAKFETAKGWRGEGGEHLEAIRAAAIDRLEHTTKRYDKMCECVK